MRTDRHPGDPGRRRTRFLRAMAAGLLAVCAYAAGAWITGRATGPGDDPILFDGFAPPPPYRWVRPPPELAAGNQPPAPARQAVPLGPGGSEEITISTPDLQATVFLVSGASPPEAGQESVVVTIEPRAPDPGVSVSGGFGIVGNVYRIAARYQPSGLAADRRLPARVVLVYPGPPGEGFDHIMLASRDGRSWRSLETMIAAPQHQAAADVTEFGFFAVGRRGQASGGLSGQLRIAVPVLLAVAAILVAYFGMRRRRAAQ